MAEKPPYQLTEKSLEDDKRQFVAALNRLLEELYRTKQDRPEFSPPPSGP